MKLKHIKTFIFVTIFVVLAAGSIYNIRKQSSTAPDIIKVLDTQQPFSLASGDTSAPEGPKQYPEDAAVTVSEEPDNGLVNINTAGQTELEALPGIGPVKARAIIDYRKAYKGFVSPEEIMEVRGIGKATYQKIKDLITIE